MIKGFIFDSGIFMGITIWQLFFGWLYLSRDIFGYSKQSENLVGWDFLGLSFDPGIFGGFVGSPRVFFFWI